MRKSTFAFAEAFLSLEVVHQDDADEHYKRFMQSDGMVIEMVFRIRLSHLNGHLSSSIHWCYFIEYMYWELQRPLFYKDLKRQKITLNYIFYDSKNLICNCRHSLLHHEHRFKTIPIAITFEGT